MNQAAAPAGFLAHEGALGAPYTRMSAAEAADLLHCGFKVEGGSPLRPRRTTLRVDASDGRSG